MLLRFILFFILTNIDIHIPIIPLVEIIVRSLNHM